MSRHEITDQWGETRADTFQVKILSRMRNRPCSCCLASNNDKPEEVPTVALPAFWKWVGQLSRVLFFAFGVFCRELSVPFLFPFQFLFSLQFHVLFVICSFLFLTFAQFILLNKLDFVITSIKNARASFAFCSRNARWSCTNSSSRNFLGTLRVWGSLSCQLAHSIYPKR